MMRALVIGYGKMGHLLADLAPEYNIAISAVVDRSADLTGESLPESCLGNTGLTQEAIDTCDIVFDFSNAKDILQRILMVASSQKPMIVGTTGWEKNEKEAKEIIHETQSALLYSPNFSLGVALFKRLVDYAGELFSQFPQYDVGMMEIHHKQKKDAPSGTAFALASKLSIKPCDISSLRSGYHPGTHELIFDSQEDSITLTHRARNREGFVRGALESAYWLIDKKGWYTLDDMIEEKISTKRKHS